jgi:hypothetical protein
LVNFVNVSSDNADYAFTMINPISAYASYVSQISQLSVRQPQPQAQTPKSSSVPQDTVSLKSTGDVDHDGDSR